MSQISIHACLPLQAEGGGKWRKAPRISIAPSEIARIEQMVNIHIAKSEVSSRLGMLVMALAYVALTGCAAGSGAVVIDPGPVVIHQQGGHVVPLNIPEGHLPPPGSCRIWFPDLPAGQQPPPGDCEDLRYRVPPGAYLIRG